MSRLVPKLRFKEFSGEWKERKLGDVGNTFNGLTGKTKEDFGIGKPYIQYMQVFSNYKIDVANFGLVTIKPNDRQNKVKYGDIFFTTSSETLKEIGLSSVLTKQVNEVYLNSFCFGYRPKSLDELVPEFSQFFFRNETVRKKIIGLGQGSTRVNISKVKLLELKFYFPEKQEQQKIASCLSSLDALIEAQNKKVSVLKQHKKGLMQQLFPKSGETTPTLRFKAFSGEWEEKIISDLANRYDNLRIPIAASNRIEGVTPYYGANGIQSYIQGYTHDGEYILVAEDGANDLQNYPVQYVNGKVWVNNHTHVLQGKKGISNNIFLMHAIQNTNIRPYLVGGGRAKLNANIMMKISFLVPKPKEQQKIANTLSTLDNLIEAQNQQINHLKQHKKGLMQQLFVNSEVGA